MKELKNIPNHIAFIVDGNGRWAKKRLLPRNVGHKYGVEAVKKAIDACLELNVKIASFFVFSTENWKRPKDEVDGIFNLLREYFKTDLEFLHKKGVKILVSGLRENLDDDIEEIIENSIKKTRNNTNLIVNFCLNYGGRREILNAVSNIIKDNLNHIDEQTFKNYLFTKDLPDPDLVIRTSGELRFSNFMLYQCAYSELYFTKTLWPDFNKKHLIRAIKNYQKRNRRFGAIK